jgi:hypothetical protein
MVDTIGTMWGKKCDSGSKVMDATEGVMIG